MGGLARNARAIVSPVGPASSGRRPPGARRRPGSARTARRRRSPRTTGRRGRAAGRPRQCRSGCRSRWRRRRSCRSAAAGARTGPAGAAGRPGRCGRRGPRRCHDLGDGLTPGQRAEREADAYRAEPAQVRAGAGHDADAKTARAGHIPAVRAPTRGEAATGRFALWGIDTRRPKVTRQLDVTKVPRSRDLRRAYRAGLWRLPVQEAQVPRRLSDLQRRRGSWLIQSCLGTELGGQCYRCGRDPGNVHTVIRSVETGSMSSACKRCA